ncbi:hypothetical protein D9758_018185 [Tetrapyrgos nigripes]|uniref:Uncharacterized protein n=1 Tax=Tetrapyrgos nigripes TaxID=182062 RepID=A0A8H5C6F6_9AGAR|nr:hypothetical protein D9758_018185 [Tetrapyrgos nigripes]
MYQHLITAAAVEKIKSKACKEDALAWWNWRFLRKVVFLKVFLFLVAIVSFAVVGIDAELPSDSLRLICQISTHQTFQYQQQHKMTICLEDFARGLLVELRNFSAVYILTLPPRCSQRCNPSGWKDKRHIPQIEWITGMRWQLWEAPGPIIKPAEQVAFSFWIFSSIRKCKCASYVFVSGVGSSRYGGLGIPSYDYGYDQGFLLLTPESSTMQKRNLQVTLVEEEVRARDLEGEEDEGESTEGDDGDGTETEGEGNSKKRHQYEQDHVDSHIYLHLDAHSSHKKASKLSLKKKPTKTLGSDDASSTNTNSASSSPTTSSSTTALTRRPSLKKKKSSSNTKGTKKTLHLSPSTLTDIYELGTGNRGSVMKVKHIETGMVLAKKVSLSVPFFVFISVVVAIVGYFVGIIVDMGTMGWLPFLRCWNYGLGICQNLCCGDYEVPLELVLKAEMCCCLLLGAGLGYFVNKVTGAKYIVTSYGAYLQEPNICICMEFMDRGSFDSQVQPG